MPDQTPEQREAALKLAMECLSSREAVTFWADVTHDLASALLDLHAENVKLREELEDAPHDEDCAYIASICQRDERGGRRLPNEPCNCWKSRAALSGSPATEATQKESFLVQP